MQPRPKHKLTDEQAVIIRERAAAGESLVKLAEEFGFTSVVSIEDLVEGYTYKGAGGPIIVPQDPETLARRAERARHSARREVLRNAQLAKWHAEAAARAAQEAADDARRKGAWDERRRIAGLLHSTADQWAAEKELREEEWELARARLGHCRGYECERDDDENYEDP